MSKKRWGSAEKQEHDTREEEEEETTNRRGEEGLEGKPEEEGG